ncbi:MAG TPA: hypothetical protein VFX16_32210 [Pseudonocardiaceae bacterium]|nr:hypothetical protein [Pseudonocardiaceae bacterium]
MIHDAGTRTPRSTPSTANRYDPTNRYEPPPTPLTQDRNGYWFPMLLFGLLILAAPWVYQTSGPSDVDSVWNPAVGSSPQISGLAFAPLQQFGTCDAALGDPMSVALYWFCVVMFGPLVSLLWYHRRARRSGLAPQTGWHLLYASTSLALYVVLFPVIEFVMLHMPDSSAGTLSRSSVLLFDLLTVAGFVAGLAIAAVAAVPRRFGRRLSSRRWTVAGLGMLLAIASAATMEFLTYLQPRNSYAALLIIAVGLLALSLVERGRVCVVVAALFTVTALVVNLVGAGAAAGWFGVSDESWSSMGTAFANLVLPAAILLIGGLVGVAAMVVNRRRPVRGTAVPGVTMM